MKILYNSVAGHLKYGKDLIMEWKKDQPTTIDEYITQFPQDVQQILARIRAVIKESAPRAVEKISYGMPAFYLNGNLVWFGAYKRHIGFYPKTAGMEAIDGLSAYKGTKGSLHFSLNKPIPYDLIGKIVKVRVAEDLENR
jgi:uncharacterized protein YdhG (YjbR/CyaY superfamily)